MSLVDLLQPREREASPLVVSPLDPGLRRGLIGLLSCSLLSVIATSSLLVWLTWRLVFWRRYYSRYIGRNQCIILIFNLLLADLQQSSSFLVTPYWLRTDQLSAHSPACFAQAWLINIGDVSSGLFVLAIAAHTFTVVVMRKLLGFRMFLGCIIGLWILCVVVTLLAPALHGRGVFVPSGGWCWIDRKYEAERLYLHYLWIFISEFGSIALYATLYIILRRRIAVARSLGQTQDSSVQKFSKVIRYMLLYPIAYLVLSLPIAAGRMSLMNGHDPGPTYFYVAGCMIMCSGWVDSIIYFTTRRRLLEADLHSSSEGGTSSNRLKHYPYGNGTSSHNNHHDAGASAGGGGATAATGSGGAGRRWRLFRSESTDHIIEAVEFAELNQVQQTTVIEISSEPRGGSAASMSSSGSPDGHHGIGKEPKIPRPAS